MAERSSPKATFPGRFGLDFLLPDEAIAEFVRLRDGLIAELDPGTEYQRCLAMSIVMAEWEIIRHRRLLAAAIRDEFRDQAAAVLTHRSPGSRYYEDSRLNTVVGRSLLAGDAKTLSKIRQSGVPLPEITAAALNQRFTTVAYHEGRIADLEKRRRSLRPEYEALKAKRPPVDDIEDAVEVE